MSEFWTLFKYELKTEFPFRITKGKKDFVGQIFSTVISLFVIAAFVFLIYSVVNNYIDVKVDKISDPTARAMELINLLYIFIITIMSFLGVEKMRKALTQRTHKEIFLRLPIKQETIFLSKLTVLLLWFYVFGFFLVVPVNLIFFLALQPDTSFWANAALVWACLPIVPFMISCILIVPYIVIVDFIKTRYVLLFLILSGALIGAFFLYSEVLSYIQELLETGSIKFLFNIKFITFLQGLLTYAYPSNSLAKIALGVDMLESVLIVALVFIIGCIAIYFVTNRLYFLTMYKNNDATKKGSRPTKVYKLNPIVTLIKKEFISIFREPKHLFSYFAIAVAMPMMVYSCYTLFESLIQNTIGLSVNFSLALMIVLIFSVLTNTFCATNITRDGLSNLKIKSMPIKATNISLAKVIFCEIVSSLSVVASTVLLIAATSLTTLDGLVVILCGLIFSTTQIFIATRLDLNHTKVSVGPKEVEVISNRTIATVVGFGLVMASLVGVSSLVISLISASSALNILNIDFDINIMFAYIIPVSVCLIYGLIGIFYYKHKIENSFAKLTM